MNTILVSFGIFAIALVIIIAIRAKAGPKFEIKNTDIILALVPLALWLFLTGKVQEFALGDFKIVASAIKDASKSPVSTQVTKLPVETIHTETKEGVEKIPALLERHTQALSFSFGMGHHYYGPAIHRYFDALTKSPSFKYVVINNEDGSFFGMGDAQQMGALFNVFGGIDYADSFANWLNSSDKEKVSKMPGFISSEMSLKQGADKQRALRLMDSLDVQTLPVVNNKDQFEGIVDRAKLTASVLVDIADRLENK